MACRTTSSNSIVAPNASSGIGISPNLRSGLRQQSIFPHWSSASRFGFSTSALCFNAPAFCSAGDSGLAPWFRLDSRLLDHGAQAIEHCFAIAFLRAFGLGDDVNLAGFGETFAGEAAQALDRGLGKSGDRIERDPQLSAGVELVDILPAGSAAAGVLEAHSI